MFEKEQLTKKTENFSQWYNEVVLKAQLADYGPVKGTMVIRPYGYSLWEGVQNILGKAIKEDLQTPNAYFPLFIPYSFLEKEKEHVKGFSPELAVVTIAGGEELAEKMVVRPTSETIMYSMFSKWIKSWRDLPFKVNQWCNIVRWEKRTYLFLRTSEFLWQEGHTAHATFEEADQMAKEALEVYKKFAQETLAIPVIAGKKSETEKFAGAKTSYTVESLMPDGKALQSGTSHNLADHFAKVFNIRYQSKDKELLNVFQSSWGLSTRILGGLIMVHGDDNGLVLPPKIASVQTIVVPVDSLDNTIVFYSKEIVDLLKKAGIRADLDLRETLSLGYKFNDWELKGVPLRIEIGKKEIEQKTITVVRRDTGKKVSLTKKELVEEINHLLDEIQADLFLAAQSRLAENTFEAESYLEFKDIMKDSRGFIKAFWCESAECEQKIKEETKATVRVIPFEQPECFEKCIYCQKPASVLAYFAQAY